jgi:hypothetical protein
MKTFEEFQATRSAEPVDISELTYNCFDIGYQYHGECYIMVEDEYYYLIIGNQEFDAMMEPEGLEMLERILYEQFYIHEIGE